MKFYSTNKNAKPVSFKEALLKGIADDGGLYMPETFPDLNNEFFSDIEKFSFNEIAFKVLKPFLENEIETVDIEKIIDKAFYFDAPLISLSENLNILELFHGPTLAFKDFGARFMAQVMSHFLKEKEEVNILVATSGDTGSAVANGFYDVPGIKVTLLYPSGKVSAIQEKQLTTFDKNIAAIEVEGNFDDCQRLVKQAFADEELNEKLKLSSANSINIARLLPQSLYYFYAYAKLKNKGLPLVFSVPSGNLGNLTGGLIAKKMGLPVSKFIAALNSNFVFYEYLQTGKYTPRPTIRTISNAMDVGNPSNFYRITEIFNKDYEIIKDIIFSRYFSDEDTINGIKEVQDKFGYIIDPHGSVGYLALKDYLQESESGKLNGIILETAHPAKFIDVIERAVDQKIVIPERLKSCLEKEKKSTKISSDLNELKEFLINY